MALATGLIARGNETGAWIPEMIEELLDDDGRLDQDHRLWGIWGLHRDDGRYSQWMNLFSAWEERCVGTAFVGFNVVR